MNQQDAPSPQDTTPDAVQCSRRNFLKKTAGGAFGAIALNSTLLGAAETKPADAKTPPPASPPKPKQGTPTVWVPQDAPNTPMGVARGVFPGRVSWARNLKATPWHGDVNTGHWWDEKTGIVQEEVDKMTSACLRALTGTKTDAAAWDLIFRHHNKTRLGKDVGYQPGESVALKPNCNNAYAGYIDEDNQIDAAPQSILAMLRQLVNEAKVPQDKILVYEAVRVVPEHVYAPCHKEFPGVVWMDSKGDGANGRVPLVWHKDAFKYSHPESGCGTSVPDVVERSTYLINMALLKGHPTTAFTVTAKNHYGSINARDHKVWINTWQHKMGIYNPFVDLIGTKQLGGKTILFMIDGLFGTNDANDLVTRECAAWKKLFGGEWSASFFMSLDPVAIDSVGLDFLHSEWGEYLASSRWYGHNLNADNYLHEAALADKAPSGTVYSPDGQPLPSLGVHEHWNNPLKKQYSRNLSSDGKGIELVVAT